jgi:hypothetical protein
MPILSRAEDRASKIAAYTQDETAVVRVRVIAGGETGRFLVTQVYQGSYRPFALLTLPVLSTATCGPGRVKFFDSGILAFDSRKRSFYFDRFEIERDIAQAIKTKRLPQATIPPVDVIATVAGAITVLIFGLALFYKPRAQRASH